MNRRNFLRGLAALVGGIAVGKPLFRLLPWMRPKLMEWTSLETHAFVKPRFVPQPQLPEYVLQTLKLMADEMDRVSGLCYPIKIRGDSWSELT